MKEMEFVSDYHGNNNMQMIISNEIKNHLTTIYKWSRFFAVLSFISAAFMAVLGILMLFLGAMLETMSKTIVPPTPPVSVMGPIYLIAAFLYFIPAYFLLKFANKTKRALWSNEQATLNDGFLNLKHTFKTLGILTIIMIVFTVFVVLATFIGMTLLSASGISEAMYF